jgi:hypothetical protein
MGVEGRPWSEARPPRLTKDQDLDRQRLAEALGAAPAPRVEIPSVPSPKEQGFVSRLLLTVRRPPWAEAAPAAIAPPLEAAASHIGRIEEGAARAREALAGAEGGIRLRYAVSEADGFLETVGFHAGMARELLVRAVPAGAENFGRIAARVREHLGSVHADAASASEVLSGVASEAAPVRQALHETREIDRAARLAEGELRMASGRAEVLQEMEAGTASFSEPAAEVAPPEEAELEAPGTLTEEDLARIGSAFDPAKPPAQTL